MEQEQEEKLEPVQEPAQLKEQAISDEGKPNFLKRFWFVFVGLGLVLILSMAGFWLLIISQKKISPKTMPTPTIVPSPTPVVETDISALQQQGTSDEISAIEADLEATDLSGLDKELTEIESELSSP